MKKLLITGASGFLGWNLCKAASRNWDVVGTMFNHQLEIPKCTIIRVDLVNYKAIKDLLYSTKPQAIIHAAAQSDPNYCQNYRAESQRINIDAAVNLAGLCTDLNIPYVFVSSDLVFDGLNPPYREDSPVSPVSFYGEQKAMAESKILDRCPLSIVARLPLMFGYPGPVAFSFLQPMIENMQNGKKLTLFTDEFRTPTSGHSAAIGLLQVIDYTYHDIIHLGGVERVSRYEFGRMVAEEFGLPTGNIVACKRSDFSMSAPRPPDVSLDSSKAIEFGFEPLPLQEELALVRKTIADANEAR